MRFKRRWKRYVFLAVVLWLVVAAGLVLDAYRNAKDGRAALRAASKNATTEALISGSLDSQLQSASASLGKAHSELTNPLVQPFRLLPVAGRQLSSAQALTGVAATVSDVAVDSLTQVRSLDQEVLTDRASALAKMATIAHDAEARINGLSLGPQESLASPLANGRNEISQRLADLQTTLSRASAGADGMSKLLNTDSKYLVVAANNGEMRAGSGMFLQVGVLTTSGGNFHLGDLQTVGDLNVPSSAVTWPNDMQARWGWIGQRADLRNLMMSPRFDQSAPIAAQIWKAAGNGDVDGVMAIDPAMLRALMAATGPVTVDGKQLNANNIVNYLLIDQYRSLVNSGSTAASQAARREGLAQVARASFDSLNRGAWNPTVLARELGKAADGRHVMLWSADATQNANWQRAGVGGDLEADSMMLSSINVGANKVDAYLDIDASVAQVTGRSGIDMSVAVTVKNNAPADAPWYVLGAPGRGLDLAEGEYSGLLSLNVPGDATGLRLDGTPHLAALGGDGPTQVIATDFRLKRGETAKFVFRFTRSATARVTMIEASSRVPGTTWLYQEKSWVDDSPRVIHH